MYNISSCYILIYTLNTYGFPCACTIDVKKARNKVTFFKILYSQSFIFSFHYYLLAAMLLKVHSNTYYLLYIKIIKVLYFCITNVVYLVYFKSCFHCVCHLCNCLQFLVWFLKLFQTFQFEKFHASVPLCWHILIAIGVFLSYDYINYSQFWICKLQSQGTLYKYISFLWHACQCGVPSGLVLQVFFRSYRTYTIHSFYACLLVLL